VATSLSGWRVCWQMQLESGRSKSPLHCLTAQLEVCYFDLCTGSELNSGNACYHSVQSLFVFPSPLWKLKD
jgi:hypothetical protein